MMSMPSAVGAAPLLPEHMLRSYDQISSVFDAGDSISYLVIAISKPARIPIDF